MDPADTWALAPSSAAAAAAVLTGLVDRSGGPTPPPPPSPAALAAAVAAATTPLLLSPPVLGAAVDAWAFVRGPPLSLDDLDAVRTAAAVAARAGRHPPPTLVCAVARPCAPDPAVASASALALAGLAEGGLRDRDLDAALAAVAREAGHGPPLQRSAAGAALAASTVAGGLPSASTCPDAGPLASLITDTAADAALAGVFGRCLFTPAAEGAAPAAAGAALDAASASASARAAPLCARALAAVLGARLHQPATHAAASAALTAVAASARDTAASYGRLAITSPAFLGAVGPARLRRALDGAFLSGLALVRAAAPAAGAVVGLDGGGGPPNPAATVSALDALASLSFARPPPPGLPAHADVVGALVGAAAADARVGGPAAAALAACLPPYGELTRGGPPPAWQADTIAAARVSFLLHALAACVAGVPAQTAERGLVPVALLFMAHPAPGVAAAALAAGAALVSAGPPALRPAVASATLSRVAEASPWLDAPSGTPDDGPDLPAFFAAAARGCPPPALAAALARAAAAAGDRLAAAGPVDAPAPPGALRLLSAATTGLVAADAAAAGPGAVALAAAVGRGRPGSRAAKEAVAAVGGVIAGWDDAVRKPTLVGWYQGLAAAVGRGGV